MKKKKDDIFSIITKLTEMTSREWIKQENEPQVIMKSQPLRKQRCKQKWVYYTKAIIWRYTTLSIGRRLKTIAHSETKRQTEEEREMAECINSSALLIYKYKAEEFRGLQNENKKV